MNCFNCKFSSYPNPYFHADALVTVNPPTYKCTRHAPIVTGGMMSPAWTAWPAVGAKDHCGDWEHDGLDQLSRAALSKPEATNAE